MKTPLKIRIPIILITAITLCAVAHVFSLQGRWLQAENARLEPLWRVLVWFADMTSLLWLIWFGLNYGLLGFPLANDESGDRERRSFVASFLVALAIDGAITGTTALDEINGQSRAITTPAQVIDGRFYDRSHEKAYLHCRFNDRNGVRHDSELLILILNQPQFISDAIVNGKFPIQVSVKYDPAWPPRCWLVGFDNNEGDRLHWMSATFMFFQIVCLPLWLKYARLQTQTGWIPLYKVIPIWCELFLLMLVQH